MRAFLCSSIRVHVLLVGICSFLELVCLKWRWTCTKIHVIHHGLALSNLIFFSVFLSKSMCIYSFGPSSSPNFSHQLCCSDSNSPRVSRTLLNIQANLSILDGIYFSSDFLLFESISQFLGDCSKCTNYSWYHRHLHVPWVFLHLSKVQIFISLFILLLKLKIL